MTNRTKILVTGANGMMGSDIIPILGREFDLLPTDIEELDVCSQEDIRRTMREFGPDWVLHLAAMTDLDRCEVEPKKAEAVNSDGTRNLAKACFEFGASMIYISTSGVFSGSKRIPYTEDDIPKPRNIYGLTKFEGEQAVKSILPKEKWLILRAGWLFGGGPRDKKFVGKIYKIASQKGSLQAVNDIFGSPNYTMDIGRLMGYLIKNRLIGVYHVANEGWTNRFEIAREVVRLAGVDCVVEPVPSTYFKTTAPRPPMEAIESIKLGAIGYNMRPWREALAEYVERLAK
jgi:dTDP-4-dehydrorhamnose reductase